MLVIDMEVVMVDLIIMIIKTTMILMMVTMMVIDMKVVMIDLIIMIIKTLIILMMIIMMIQVV